MAELAAAGFQVEQREAPNVEAASTNEDETKHELDFVAPGQVRLDALLADVLEFAPGTDLHALPAVSEGRLVLQDKASCLTAAALAPPPDAIVVDACAAPGNKTTHCAALMRVAAGEKEPTGSVLGGKF